MKFQLSLSNMVMRLDAYFNKIIKVFILYILNYINFLGLE